MLLPAPDIWVSDSASDWTLQSSCQYGVKPSKLIDSPSVRHLGRQQLMLAMKRYLVRPEAAFVPAEETHLAKAARKTTSQGPHSRMSSSSAWRDVFEETGSLQRPAGMHCTALHPSHLSLQCQRPGSFEQRRCTCDLVIPSIGIFMRVLLTAKAFKVPNGSHKDRN